MSCLPTNEKYIMFLNQTFFKKRIFKSLYKKIIKRLENKGIVIFNIKDAIDELKTRHKNTVKYRNRQLMFDDYPFPNTNTLYIHLFNSQYYSENIYNKKKIEVEREMLFLLAGKLGVKTINYETEVVETTISKANAELKIRGMGPSIKFNKSINKTKGIKGMEEYLNRGAPVYLKSDNLQEVEKNIEDRMGMMQSNIFNYNFYKHSPKLESFVYKRYEFKMQKIDYTIETEDISDISFAVKACFIENGIDVSFDKNITYTENIHYVLEFFTDIELKKEFGKMKRDFMDKFHSIRELYDLIDDKDNAVHLISEYVIDFANNYHYKLKNNDTIYNFSKHIHNFIRNNEYGAFEDLCHKFQSTSQIRNWINKEFITDDMEIVDSNKKAEVLIEEQHNNISVSKVPIFEKKELDVFKRKENDRIRDLQFKLEKLAQENNSEESSDLELSKIINNCDNNTIETDKAEPRNSTSNISLQEDDYYNKKDLFIDENIFAHYLSTVVINPPPPPRAPPGAHIRHNSDADIKYYQRDIQITEDKYAHNLATCVDDCYEEQMKPEQFIKIEDINRPPVFPLSTTPSINSIVSILEQEKLSNIPFPSFPPPPPPPPPNSSNSSNSSDA